ncbi:MAG: protein translocase subunit SecD [Actinomycetota bacterium]
MKSPRPARPIIGLFAAVLVLLVSIVIGSRVSDASLTPQLALDLEGGTQLILTPRTEDGSEISEDDINQAIEIIRQRVDASGVAEAEITRQGQQNIVVALPGEPDESTLNLVRQSAQLRFRPVIFIGSPATIDPGALEAVEEQAGEPDSTLTEPGADAQGEDAATDAPTAEPTGEPTAEPTETARTWTREEIEAAAFVAADADSDGVLSATPASEPADNSSTLWFTEQLAYDYYVLDCLDPANLAGGDTVEPANPTVACAVDGSAKYVLGPADVEGTQITQAASGLETTTTGTTTNNWIVTMSFNGEGADAFADATTRLKDLPPPQDQFAIALDGLVVSAPSVSSTIANGEAMISGSFTRESAATLANQLNFGSLPLNFEVQSEEQISATLGLEQLQRGVLAGAIGLGLVLLYMMFQYRALAVVAAASLTVAALITYLMITLLGWTTGYRLSLAGVAGLIVAIGITADSFIVYFERVRDEVREGRSLQDAVEFGWLRARRTIIVSDAVNLLAATVLYFLAVGGVRGFAFTLGLTTVVDLGVVVLFTHPMMQLLIRTRFFGQGHRLSGLDPERLGASAMTYRGRGSFRAPLARSGPMTIAERRAAQAAREKEAARVSAGQEDER